MFGKSCQDAVNNTVRRIVSADYHERKHFWMQKALPEFQQKCFANATVSQVLLSWTTVETNVTTSKKCGHLAMRGIRGEDRQYPSHLTQYYEGVFNTSAGRASSTHLLVIRTEHMTEDLIQIEHEMFGGNASAFTNVQVANKGSIKLSVDDGLKKTA